MLASEMTMVWNWESELLALKERNDAGRYTEVLGDGAPVASVKFIHETQEPLNWLGSDVPLQLRAEADTDGVPMYSVIYDDSFDRYQVKPGNALAKAFLPKETEMRKHELIELLAQREDAVLS